MQTNFKPGSLNQPFGKNLIHSPVINQEQLEIPRINEPMANQQIPPPGNRPSQILPQTQPNYKVIYDDDVSIKKQQNIVFS